MYNTLICDDHPLVSIALKAVLQNDPEFNIIGEPKSGPELVAALRRATCDLVILDYSMPGDLDGIALIQYLCRMYPQTRIMVFSGTASAAIAARCMEAGAHGFMHKTKADAAILSAIKRVARGHVYIDPSLQQDVNQASAFEKAFLSLSPREMAVVRLLLSGCSVTEIANKLNRSIKTVSTQKQTAYRKLTLHSDAELFQLARELNISFISHDPPRE